MSFSKHHCLKPGILPSIKVFNLISDRGSHLCKDILVWDPSALTWTPPCQTMKIRPSAAFSVQLTKPFPSGCVLSPLAPLSCPFGGGKVLTAEQGSSAMLCCSSPSTHRLGISPQARGILWPAVEWALCSRAHVLALALNPLQFLSAQPQPPLIHAGLKGRRTP